MTKEQAKVKAKEAEMLENVNEQLSKLDEVECEYYFDKDDDNAPVLIFHQEGSFIPLFILRPVYHSMLEIKNFIITNVEEYTCWEDGSYEGTKDNEYIMKYFKTEEKLNEKDKSFSEAATENNDTSEKKTQA